MDGFFTASAWGAEIEFGAQTKKMSCGEHKTQSPLDGSDVLTHKQDNGMRRRRRRRGKQDGSGDRRGNVEYCVTE